MTKGTGQLPAGRLMPRETPIGSLTGGMAMAERRLDDDEIDLGDVHDDRLDRVDPDDDFDPNDPDGGLEEEPYPR